MGIDKKQLRRREKVKAVGESLNKAKAAKILIRI